VLTQGVVLAGLAAALIAITVSLAEYRAGLAPGPRKPRFSLLFECVSVLVWTGAGMLVAFANESTTGPLAGTVALSIGLGTPSFFMTAAREVSKLRRT